MARSLNTKVNKMKLRPAAPTRSNMLTFMTHESHAGRHTRVTTSMAAGIHMWTKQNPVIIAPSTSLPPTLHQNPSHSNYQQEHGEKRLALAETPKKNNPSQHQQPHPPYLNGLPPPRRGEPVSQQLLSGACRVLAAACSGCRHPRSFAVPHIHKDARQRTATSAAGIGGK